MMRRSQNNARIYVDGFAVPILHDIFESLRMTFVSIHCQKDQY